MRVTSWKALAVLSCALAPVSYAQQCGLILDTAKRVGLRLTSNYFPNGVGGGAYWNGGYLWTDANTLEDLHNLMLATGSDEWRTIAENSFIGRTALDAGADWRGILNGSNDDAGWVILALWKIADYKGSRGIDNGPYERAASTIYNIIKTEWDGTCGGGLWWSSQHTYKNAITNQLFLYISAQGFLRYRNFEYLDNAKKTWTWLANSGMRNADGLWNDGLDNNCRNNGQTTWTYNQGVIASGLGALYAATGDRSLLDQAEITLDATRNHLTNNGILREPCDDPAGSVKCNQDQQIFKGIWMKHLQFYLDNVNDGGRVDKYRDFVHAQYSGITHFATNGAQDVGSVWYAPDQGGDQWTRQSSGSGLAAHVAAAKFGTCAP